VRLHWQLVVVIDRHKKGKSFPISKKVSAFIKRSSFFVLVETWLIIPGLSRPASSRRRTSTHRRSTRPSSVPSASARAQPWRGSGPCWRRTSLKSWWSRPSPAPSGSTWPWPSSRPSPASCCPLKREGKSLTTSTDFKISDSLWSRFEKVSQIGT